MKTIGLASVLAVCMAGVAAQGEEVAASKTLSITLAEAQGTTPAVVVELIGVPAGEFMMGTNPDPEYAPPRYDPKGEFYHRVRISRPFYLGKTELTHAQWGAVMGMHSRYEGREQHPQNGISWVDSTNFTAVLNARFASQLPEGMVFRLPTEAEWEYAARAGTTTAYYFGNDPAQLDEYAWYRGNATDTMPVGQKKPNAWGFYDIIGNVWELCIDFVAPDMTTKEAISVDPVNITPYEPVAAAVRGGSYVGQDGPESIRIASQWANIWPDKHRVNVGLRLAIGFPVSKHPVWPLPVADSPAADAPAAEAPAASAPAP
jgi:formylglycine-generating enzyme required for sulfatase activity